MTCPLLNWATQDKKKRSLRVTLTLDKKWEICWLYTFTFKLIYTVYGIVTFYLRFIFSKSKNLNIYLCKYTVYVVYCPNFLNIVRAQLNTKYRYVTVSAGQCVNEFCNVRMGFTVGIRITTLK